MTTITVTIADPTASLNISHQMTISDADAATMLAAYAQQFPGTPSQTIQGWCMSLFSQMLSVATAYKAQQAQIGLTSPTFTET